MDQYLTTFKFHVQVSYLDRAGIRNHRGIVRAEKPVDAYWYAQGKFPNSRVNELSWVGITHPFIPVAPRYEEANT